MASINGNNLSKATTKPQVALVTVKSLMANPKLQKRFDDMLGKKAAGFIGSLINISTLSGLAGVEPMSIISSAAVAATLDLPIDPNLGFAYIVPYNRKENGAYVKKAQFQIGYKGFIQLAMRSGQYKTINATEIYKGEIKKVNRLTGEIELDESGDVDEEIIVGYIAYFRLLNGFEKALYMTTQQLEKHAKKYSQTYKNSKDYIVKQSKWTTDFGSMATKTVLKLLLSKYGMLSIEMQTALKTDQGVIKDLDGQEVEYDDNPLNDKNAVETDYSEVEKEDAKQDSKEKNIKEDGKIVDKAGDDAKPPWEQTNS